MKMKSLDEVLAYSFTTAIEGLSNEDKKYVGSIFRTRITGEISAIKVDKDSLQVQKEEIGAVNEYGMLNYIKSNESGEVGFAESYEVPSSVTKVEEIETIDMDKYIGASTPEEELLTEDDEEEGICGKKDDNERIDLDKLGSIDLDSTWLV